MKTAILTLAFGFATVFGASSVRAQSATTVTIKQEMKIIGGLMKKIGQTSTDASLNAQNADFAGQVAEAFQATLNLVPDSIAQLPADQQAQAIQGYRQLIQQEIDLAKALQQAFAANDNAKVADILKQMNDIKKDGHGQFAD